MFQSVFDCFLLADGRELVVTILVLLLMTRGGDVVLLFCLHET